MFRKPSPSADAIRRPIRRTGFSIVELLIVLSIMAVLAGMVITRFEPTFQDQLISAGEIVAADLHYARSLAVTHNSRYSITFDVPRHRYRLEHSGTNAGLNVLPESPYRDPSDPPTRHTTDFTKLRALGSAVELVAVRKVSSTTQADAGALEIGPLGSLTQPEDSWIWLAVGRGTARVYLPIEVDAVTGLADVHPLQTAAPPPVGAVASPPLAGTPLPRILF